MSQTRNCPVCGRPGLPPDCGSCPQCDADLTCFQALDSLASPAAATVAAPPKKRRFPWAAAGVLALIALLLLAGLAASMKSRLSELDRQLAELKAAEARTATESKPKRQPIPAAPPPPAEQAAKPPESKIQIDARVRIIDEREAAGSAAVEESKQPVVAAKEMKKIAAVQPGEERKPASDAAQAAAAQPVAGPVEQADAKSKVVREIIRQPDKEKDEPLGAPMPPPPAAKTAEQSAAAASEASEKPKEEQPQSVVADRPASEEGRDPAEIADPPATPPVLLKPGFRKHRARPVAAAEGMTTRPAPAASPQQPGGTFAYIVKDGETVWDIAGRFYGDRKYYPVVMEQNPHIFLGFIRKNSTVRLFADRKEAEALYERRTERRDGLLLWKYEVRSGETWRTVYARFFLPRYSGMIFYGNQDVAPGKTVLVILR